MRYLLRGLLLLVLLLLAAPLALVALLGSDAGSAWILRQAAGFAGQQGFEIGFDRIRGNLLGRLELSGVRFAGADTRVDANRVLLHWRPWALLHRRLQVEAIELARLQVLLPPPVASEPEAEPAALSIPDIGLPISVRVERFDLRELRIGEGESALRIEHIALKVRADDAGLAVDGLDYAGLGITAQGELGMQSRAPHRIVGRLSARVDESLTGADVGAVTGVATLAGEALQPKLDLRLTSPTELRLEGGADLRGDQPAFDVTAGWKRLDWPLQGRAQVSAGEGRLRLAGTLDDYRLQLASGVSGEGLPPAAIDLTAQGDLGGIRLQPLHIDALDGRLTALGRVAWADGLHLDLAVEVDGLAPSSYRPDLPEKLDGTLSVQGSLADYRLQLTTRISGGAPPSASVELAAQGDLGGIRVEPLRIAVLDGDIDVRGSLAWQDGLRWDLALTARELDPAPLLPELPGRLGGRIRVTGGLGPAGSVPGEGRGDTEPLVVVAVIEEIAGRLRDYPVSAAGTVELRGEDLQARGLHLASGPNRIDLDGRIADRLDLGLSIAAPDLAALYPGLSGQLQGTGRVEGTRTAPIVVARLSGDGLGYQDLRARSLSLAVDWREAGSTARLRAGDLLAGGAEVSELSLDLDGTPRAHRFDLAAKGPQLGLTLRAQGGLEEQARGQVWTGSLDALGLDASEPALGEWRLAQPARLSLGATQARTDRLCLAQAGSSLCLAGGWDADAGMDASGSLDRIDLARLAPLLPEGMTIEGTLSGEFGASGDPARPEVALELRPGDGLVRVQGDAEPFELAYRNVAVRGRFADDRGNAELEMELGADGRARGRLTLGPAAGPDAEGDRALGGELHADFPDLGLVAGFVPVLQQVEGRLELDAEFGGSLARPRLIGGLQVVDASARVPDAGIALTDIGLEVHGAADGPLQVRGQVTSGEGRLAIEGEVDPAAAAGPAVDLRISGANVQAVRLPEAEVEVSPDLRLSGNGPYHLAGTLRIPTASIEIEEVPKGTVSVSDDEIVVGAGGIAPEVQPQKTQNLTAKVRVELGDAVTFEGFGLSTGLVGVLNAKVTADETSINGKIEMRDGKYKAYGQDLTVEQGRLLFAGPPSDPDVDLRAVRVSRDSRVKAYLAMSGPLSEPRPRIYSEPSLPEAEALAYLLTGRGLDQASGGEGPDIVAAAASLGLSKGEPLLQNLSDRLGLDDLRVDSGEGGLEESSLILGKYLNPDLYLGYSQGLFDPQGAVLLRLRLTDQLEVETRSGVEQSVDLFYRLEHD